MKLIIGILATALSASLSVMAQTNKPATIRVNQDRIEKRIMELSQFGKEPDGRTNRYAFSKGDLDARQWFSQLMKNAGLEVTIDAAGNIIGKRKGKDPSKKPITFGSHIDMVPYGGNYDGCVGSIGALEVIETLNENKFVTDHPLELIIFTDEEGGTIGSMGMSGMLSQAALDESSHSGKSMREGLKAVGGDPDHLSSAKRNKGDLAAYLELHIEQGGLLERDKKQIGIVEGIVGIEHWEVTVEGFANHAGTTPMDMRKDALLAASKLIIAVNEVVKSYPGRQVGTVGKLKVEPGAYNVIPGKVIFGLELRDLDANKIAILFKDIEKKADSISKTSGTTISFLKSNVVNQPALTDISIQNEMINAATTLGYSWQKMQSGAGHDAQEMAHITPIGMIFIPSIGGISHSPKEFSTPVDMANGVNVLLQTILSLDKK